MGDGQDDVPFVINIGDDPTSGGAGNIDRTLGVSVHWLSTGFLEEVEQAGGSKASTIYEIEPLNGPPGVIRQKSLTNIIQPPPADSDSSAAAEGQSNGSADPGNTGTSYVQCLQGEDNVGPPTFILSYAWGNTLGDIIEGLEAFCQESDRDPKRCYVWMCCLCINQHRVADQSEEKMSGALSNKDFFPDFKNAMKSIGHVLTLLTPSQNPPYPTLTRAWCIFEAFTAIQEACEVTIVMPPSERSALEADLLKHDGKRVDGLYHAISKTRIETAKTSVPKDRAMIMDICEKGQGYAAVNAAVTEFLRSWVRSMINAMVDAREKTLPETLTMDDLGFAEFCNKMGKVFFRNEDYDEALELSRKGLAFAEIALGKQKTKFHRITAKSHQDIGMALAAKGKNGEAMGNFTKALAISRVVCRDDPSSGDSYMSIGDIHFQRMKFDRAQMQYRKALDIYIKVLGEQDARTAKCHSYIGMALERQCDYPGALEEYEKAIAIRKDVFGPEHPEVAQSLCHIGDALHRNGKSNAALEKYREALVIRENALGKDHPAVAETLNGIGNVLRSKGDYDGALTLQREALEIHRTQFGEYHAETAGSISNIGITLKTKGDYDGAMKEHRKSAAIYESLYGKDHPVTNSSHGMSYNSSGNLLFEKRDFGRAIREYEQAVKIFELAETNPVELAAAYNNIGMMLRLRGDHDGAVMNYKKSLLIRDKVLGPEHPTTVSTVKRLDAAVISQQASSKD
eukprot:CAMPEP_0198290040 /NCGR_PEP_ID=MMETSP1449-20131203/8027_1 /TAXON_ID=420275 /ORGANISM="Attheya septentrionalis, Strain CCMP2084" /LENGTH=738 /DNA_ID=CAMNT_0043988467 /DNA_START=200 /DNA_END=2416 /DNA_ORIENTATION=+